MCGVWLPAQALTKGHSEGPAVGKLGQCCRPALSQAQDLSRPAPRVVLSGAPLPAQRGLREASSGPAVPCPGPEPGHCPQPCAGEAPWVKCPWLQPPACSAQSQRLNHPILGNVLCLDPFQQPQIFLV